jgi:hypothetical protein
MVSRFAILLFLLVSPLHAIHNWTVLVYMAADNDLGPFAYRNIAQMKRIGSNDRLTILIHIDLIDDDGKKVTRRFIVYPNRLEQVGPDMQADCGQEETLVDALAWAHSYHSEHLGLIFWNHGSGDLNPLMGTALNTAQLFQYNPEKKALILDRSRSFLDFVEEETQKREKARGICFNETTQTYLDDQKLKNALSIFHEYRGKQIDVIMFDACFMAGMGTAWLLHEHVEYMVGSQEVELGTGYDYSEVLRPLANKSITPKEWANHVVCHFENLYKKITPDYTHSAIDLSLIKKLSRNIHDVAELLNIALLQQKNGSALSTLKHSRNKLVCTSFEEPSYIDLRHLYDNLEHYSHMIHLEQPVATKHFRQRLQQLLTDGKNLINECIIHRVAGENLPKAHGLSIYFPENELHPSYEKTLFAQNNNWYHFLQTYCSQLKPQK